MTPNCFPSRVVPSALLLFLAACGENGRTVAETCSADSPASYQYTALQSSAANSLRPTTEIGPLEPAFGSITDIAVDSAGNMYVADAMNSALRVFSSAGDSIRSLGREGDGPGEFQSLNAVTADSDTASIFDVVLWRVTQFSDGGDSTTILSPPQLLQAGQVLEVHLAGSAVYYLAYPNFAQEIMEAMGSGRETPLRTSTEIVKWQAGQEEWETLLAVPGVEVVVLSGLSLRDLPWGRSPLWGVAADGSFWYADSGTPVITRYDSSGEKLCEIRIDAPELALSDVDRRGYYDAADVDTDDEKRLRQIRARREDIPLPTTKPILDRLMISAEGDLWVQFTSDREADAQRRWYVFDPQGRFEGSYTTPADFIPRTIANGTVYGIARDELDRQSVQVLTP